MIINGIITGLIMGGILSLPVLGVALVYGITGIPNFGIGVIGTLGGFIIWSLTPYNLPLAVFIGVGICFPIGYFLQTILLTPISVKGGDTTLFMIITISIGFVFEGLIRVSFPRAIISIDFPRLGSIAIGGITAEGFKFLALFFGIGALVAMRLLEQHTKAGLSLQATSQNLKLATLIGINTKRVFSVAHGIGCCLTCIGAIFWGALYNLTVTTGWYLAFTGFIIAVVGGIGNIWGGMISALVMGMVMSFSGYLLGGMWQSVILYGIVILVLIIAPRGILGSERSL